MTKKIDEAASLTMSAQNGDMTSSTTLSAEDIAGLAALLKNAGIAGNSAMFNGAATLTLDVEENGGTMNTIIQAPDLRSIMHLLEPEFAEIPSVDDVESDADDALAADQMKADYDAEHPEVVAAKDEVEAALAADAQDDMDMGMEPADLDTDLDGAVDAVVDANGGLSLADDLGEEADYDYRNDDAGAEEYNGVADRKPVQAQTKAVPARSGDNPMKGFKDYFKEANERNFVEPKPEVTAESLMMEFTKRRMPPTGLAPCDFKSVATKAREQSREGYVQHVDRNTDGSHSISDWMSDNTIASFSNGQHIGGKDIEEASTQVTEEPKTRYFKETEASAPRFEIQGSMCDYKIVDTVTGEVVADKIYSGHEAHNLLTWYSKAPTQK